MYEIYILDSLWGPEVPLQIELFESVGISNLLMWKLKYFLSMCSGKSLDACIIGFAPSFHNMLSNIVSLEEKNSIMTHEAWILKYINDWDSKIHKLWNTHQMIMK